MPRTTEQISRRRMLQLAASGVAASGLATGSAAAGTGVAREFDPRSPADNLYGLIKMMGSLDPEQLTWLWGVGQVTAVVAGKAATPLFDVQVCRLSYYRPLPHDVYEHRFWSCLFFVAAEDGSLLEQWRNPVTGATVQPGHYRGGPLDVLYRPDGIRTPAKLDTNPLSDGGLDPFVMPWQRHGDEVWCTFDSNFGLENYDTYVFRGSWLALVDPARSDVPTSYAYYGASRYYRWLGMTDQPGYLRWRVSGAKATRLDDVPTSIIELSEQRFPGLMRNPRSFTERAVIYRPEGTEPKSDAE